MSDDQARAALIAAAVTILGTPHSPAMPLREVAQAAGVTTGAIQHHFGNRHGLLVAAVDHQVGRLAERLEAASVAHPAGGTPRLRALLLELLPLDDERTRETRVVTAFERGATDDPTLAEEFRARYQRLLDIVSVDLPGGGADAALLLSAVYGTGSDLLLGVVTEEGAIANLDRILDLLT